jgi:hypothetical protein
MYTGLCIYMYTVKGGKQTKFSDFNRKILGIKVSLNEIPYG